MCAYVDTLILYLMLFLSLHTLNSSDIDRILMPGFFSVPIIVYVLPAAVWP